MGNREGVRRALEDVRDRGEEAEEEGETESGVDRKVGYYGLKHEHVDRAEEGYGEEEFGDLDGRLLWCWSGRLCSILVAVVLFSKLRDSSTQNNLLVSLLRK